MVNHDEVRRALDESRLDALIVVSPENAFYFSGVFIRTQILSWWDAKELLEFRQ